MRPTTFINVAMTADGKIDTFERKGSAISSKRDKARVDELRAGVDAVIVGGRTLLDESPKLTVKSEALREGRVKRGLSPNPIKVGIVSSADLHPDSDFLNTGPAPIVIFTTNQTSKEQIDFLRGRDVDVFVHESERVNLSLALEKLYELGARRVMIEGGGTINFEFLRQGLVDELMIYIAPLIFGGEHAPTLAAGLGLARSEAIALRLENVETHDDGGILLHYKLNVALKT
ncbi:MAG: dihydrofolate reductase family protein [Chloroflexi bacterium]|nr:dihydrofolate reductase family protein [Chloroflexota bacterium]